VTDHQCTRDCRRVRPAWESERVQVAKLHRYGSDAGRGAVTLASEDCNTRLITQWKPPTYGVCRAMKLGPKEVVALSRMVKIGDSKTSKLLRLCYPVMASKGYLVIVSYSDSSMGHTGNVYKLSGFIRDSEEISCYYVNDTGMRVSPYVMGERNQSAQLAGERVLTRWIKRL
jgi:hypothetical protein